MIKETFGVIGIIVLVIGGIVGLSYGGIWMYKTFAPKYKEVEREVWEQTPSRVLGATQEINKRMLEYNSVETKEEKKAICSYIRRSYPDLTPDKINDGKLRIFYEKCKYGG